jgi:hypothetical protein
MKSKMKFVLIIAGVITTLAIFIGTVRRSEAKDSAGSEGWWVLHEYHDRIMNNRRIGEFSFEQPNYVAVILNVRMDSVFSSGTIFPLKATERIAGDTICRMSSINSICSFFYNKKKKCLQVAFTVDGKRQVFSYRRMRSDEFVRLTANFFSKTEFWPLHQNYNAYWRKQFITGTFVSIDNKTSFTVSDSAAVTGFGPYNFLELDDFFGTTHWLGKADRVRFMNGNKTGQFKDYNWEYHADTLVLREYIGQEIELYKKSNKVTKYIRQPQNQQ